MILKRERYWTVTWGPGEVYSMKDEDDVDIDIEGGNIAVGGKKFTFSKLPPQILEIRDAGGLLNNARKKLEKT